MRTHRVRRRGFSLVEVSIALAVAGFCLVVVMGLLPLGLNSNENSLQTTQAASLASQVFSDLRLTPRGTGNAASPRYGLIVPGPLSTGSTAVMEMTADGLVNATGANTALGASTDPTRFRVAVSFIVPPAPAGVSASTAGLPPGQSTLVQILVTWPANVPPANANGAFETMSALDRG